MLSLDSKQFLEALKNSFDRYLKITSGADNSRTIPSILQITHVFDACIDLDAWGYWNPRSKIYN
jgi:hypothetical protein